MQASDDISITAQKVCIREADKRLFWGDANIITIAERPRVFPEETQEATLPVSRENSRVFSL